MHAIYVVRHGNTTATEAHRVCGSTDAALSPRGRREMAAAIDKLAGLGLRSVFCSPLQRARGPAEMLAERLGLTLNVVHGLREIDFGEWEGLRYHEVALRHPLEFIRAKRGSGAYTFPGGENIGAFTARVLAAFEAISASAEGPTAIFTHGGALRVIVGTLNGLSMKAAKDLDFSCGSITTLAREARAGRTFRVVQHNDYSHLPPLKPERVSKRVPKPGAKPAAALDVKAEPAAQPKTGRLRRLLRGKRSSKSRTS